MGRKKLAEGEKKELVTVLVPKKIIDSLGKEKCREIGESAVLKQYAKDSKKHLYIDEFGNVQDKRDKLF